MAYEPSACPLGTGAREPRDGAGRCMSLLPLVMEVS